LRLTVLAEVLPAVQEAALLALGVLQGPEAVGMAVVGLETALEGTLGAMAGPIRTVETGSPIPPP
jgi:hypothetical protein